MHLRNLPHWAEIKNKCLFRVYTLFCFFCFLKTWLLPSVRDSERQVKVPKHPFASVC